MTDLENQIADEILEAWSLHCTKLHAEGQVGWWTSGSREDVKSGSPWLQSFIWDALVASRSKG